MSGGPASGLSTVTAIAINWNAAADCAGLLESLRPAFSDGLRMVVLDNGSADGSAAAIRALVAADPAFGGVEVIESAENLGFCGGVNLAVAHALADASPEFVLLLNPDGEATEGMVQELVAVSRLSRAEIVGPHNTEAALGAWPRALYKRDKMVTATVLGRWRLVDRYGGACALFRVSLLRTLIGADGYFLDPKLFMYWDEWDVSLRARRFGVRIAVARDAHFEHFGFRVGAVKALRRDFRTYYIARNALLVARAHLPRRRAWQVCTLHVLREVSWSLRSAARGRPHQTRARLAGSLDGLRGRAGPWKRHPKASGANH